MHCSTDHDEEDLDSLVRIYGTDTDALGTGTLYGHGRPHLGVENHTQTALGPHHCTAPSTAHHTLFLFVTLSHFCLEYVE